MKVIQRSAFALFVLTLLSGGAYAADPAESPTSEDEAIQGSESGPASATGAGPTDATDAMGEDKAIQGGEAGPASATGAGPTDATDAMGEDKAIQGSE